MRNQSVHSRKKDNYDFCFELKDDGVSEEPLVQIDSKQYAILYTENHQISKDC